MINPFLDNTNSTDVSLSLTISESALNRLSVVFSKNNNNNVFRIRVSGGGCSGFQYTFNMDEQTFDNDFILDFDTFKVACDIESLTFINGGQIDFVDSLSGRYFTIHNPNAKASCGCGTSFSV